MTAILRAGSNLNSQGKINSSPDAIFNVHFVVNGEAETSVGLTAEAINTHSIAGEILESIEVQDI